MVLEEVNGRGRVVLMMSRVWWLVEVLHSRFVLRGLFTLGHILEDFDLAIHLLIEDQNRRDVSTAITTPTQQREDRMSA